MTKINAKYKTRNEMGPLSNPLVTICVLTYGDYPHLAERTIDSILRFCDKKLFRLVVGANAVGSETLHYLEQLLSSGDIDTLHASSTNLNKCPMMRRMFEDISTEFIWWFDDDSYIIEPDALAKRIEIARASPASTVMWGHQFFFGHENDFSYGADVVGFVKNSPWYRGETPPSWEPGGKGKCNFEGRGTGDGRWFFITGGCWLIRTKTIHELCWPDPRLIKRNDDVFLCEAIRQQGLQTQDIGPLGVGINTEPRRGVGEDRYTMELQMKERERRIHRARGCIYIPSFRDTHVLIENYSGRPEVTGDIDIIVFDDNFEKEEAQRLKEACRDNGWHYRYYGRGRHDDWASDYHDLSGYNYFIWDSVTSLHEQYDFVIKMDTDSYVVLPEFYKEMEQRLLGRAAIAGTLEYRPVQDVMAYWDLAKKAGYRFELDSHVAHMQGGIYGLSRSALIKLREMGFLHGQHLFFAEDCYISYSCRLLGIDFIPTVTTGSWWRHYRPRLEEIKHLKAIHPMTRSEWEQFTAKTEKSVLST